ncbi:MAG TPA: ferritin, partial [Candidatus Hydrogenedentes bacterium]|nr:ferritin [Candidatus Hydrogenedentota bacterium]
MISKKMVDAINDQINAELYSSYLYLAMAAYFDSINLKGFENWMRVQAQEEDFHAKKFFDYLLSRQGRVQLKAIAAPPATWKSPLDAFQATYKHETEVSARINKLATLAAKENDHATSVLLHWFINEQVEEEASADALVQKLKLIGSN